jgi:alpha-tubulin suppressor-like RCC1 family protein
VLKLPLIKNIYVGRNYCLAVSSEDGSVYGWGANQHGQLGLNNHQNLIIQTPTSIGVTLKEGDRFVLGSFQTFLLRREKM